jgi:hypothetical protein
MENTAIDIKSKESRMAAAKMVMRLLARWQLSTADQLALLGLNEKNRSTLVRYRQGGALQPRRDLLERVAYLFDIHVQLRTIFPTNRNLAYGWMTARVEDLHNLTPVEVVQKNGLIGLNMLNKYLNRIVCE